MISYMEGTNQFSSAEKQCIYLYLQSKEILLERVVVRGNNTQ